MSQSNYVSSITSRYGDVERVKHDSAILREIYKRQGPELLLDVIADEVGQSAIKFKFNNNDAKQVVASMTKDFKEALWERL